MGIKQNLPMHYVALEAQAISAFLQECLADAPAGGVVALLPEAEKQHLPLLQSLCKARGLALVGGIFPALVQGQAFIYRGVWLLPYRQMPPFFLVPALNQGASGAEKIVGAVRRALSPAVNGEKPLLFLMCDSMLPNIASLLDEVYLALSNRVDYAGVNAGSESFQPMPCLFDAEQVYADAVLGLLLPGEASAFQIEHGFALPDHALTATSTHGNCINMIDWRPAFEAYREILDQEYGVRLTAENFYQHAVHFPIGILRASGDVVVRIPVALTPEGALFCVGEIPENAMLVVLRAPDAGAGDCPQKLADKLRGAGQAVPAQLLTFYCAGRRLHLGAAATQELGQLLAASGAQTQGGALSLGEIGSVTPRGYPMFHNAALVCANWSAP